MRIRLAAALFLLSTGFGQTPAPSAKASPEDRARSVLDKALQDKNPEIRKYAVQALSLVTPGDPYFPRLEAMLTDKDVEVQLAAVASLVDLKNPRTVPALRRALDSEVPEVSFAAAKALWTLNQPAGRDALVSVLAGEGKTSSGFITRQKRDMLRMLHTPRTTFLFALKEGTGLVPVPGVGAGVSSLQGILADSGTSGRAAAALLLTTDKSPEVLQALKEGLADTDWSVRAAAVHALALHNDASIRTALLPLLDDKKEAVRVRAAAGYLRLAAIQPPPARKTLPKKALPAAGK